MITINGREVTEVHSLQKFYDYTVKPPRVNAVYIEGQYADGMLFYCKSDVDNVTVVIDGIKIWILFVIRL